MATEQQDRNELARELYALYRKRSPGQLTWETESLHRKDDFYDQADDILALPYLSARLAQAKAEAWDEGRRAESRSWRQQGAPVPVPEPTNPYRSEAGR